MASAAGTSAAGTSAAQEESIASRDKKLMDLQQQIELKEAQIKKDYHRVQRDVKHNPHLQAAVDEYKNYFARKNEEMKDEIKALTGLLTHVKTNEDEIAIKSEIKKIKQK